MNEENTSTGGQDVAGEQNTGAESSVTGTAAELREDLVSVKLQTLLDGGMPGAAFPQVYSGSLLRYAVWNYETIPTLWAESRPHAARYLVQVHLYLPRGENPYGLILTLTQALADSGFTWPSKTDASDSEGQHWVLECEYADAGAVYGYV